MIDKQFFVNFEKSIRDSVALGQNAVDMALRSANLTPEQKAELDKCNQKYAETLESLSIHNQKIKDDFNI